MAQDSFLQQQKFLTLKVTTLLLGLFKCYLDVREKERMLREGNAA